MDEADEQITDGAATSEPIAPKPTGLRRSTKRRMVGGVAGGIGERFDIDANIIRVVFVVLTVLYGLGAAIYLAMWALIPQDGKPSDGVVVVAVIVLSTLGGAPRVGNGFGILWLIFLIVLAILSLRSTARQHLLLRFIALVFLTGMTIFILVVGAFLGFLASTGVPMHGGSGARMDQPTTLAQVQSTYETEFGNMTVDLRQVQFTPGTTTVTASVAVGILNVDIPANAIVYLKTHIGAGTVTYFGRNGYQSEPFSAVPSSLKTAAEQRRAPHLVLNVQVGAGRITVQRGYPVNNPYP
jgi:phage shock protein PspC (stress-responsive transcriptional regulator)